ncbi:TerB family tellurite resistance protein [Citreicella sp. C3M06]|uniref:tellurite resistance TerB family protein n=1 Tax=Citreicella sp. C3M06 TaxID=2841564 RepID=UPI001C07FCDA|nr:TerB family tellurite resistance protein [Citreicella sp. C3M06]MBU2961781.1 TerB family tellurite resistance protein [Citreicella sp. C3M06]
MFERLKAMLHLGEAPGTPLPALDYSHALGALLVKVAMADHAYLFEEIEQIDRILAEACGLDPVRAARMRATCEKLALHGPDIETMAEHIRGAVPLAQRRAAAEALWKVVHADGVTGTHESALVALIEEHLGLGDDALEADRQRLLNTL